MFMVSTLLSRHKPALQMPVLSSDDKSLQEQIERWESEGGYSPPALEPLKGKAGKRKHDRSFAAEQGV